ncbi:MAG: hypothetical protein C5B57_07415, partial [Blastocatellia bacterium]
MPIVDRLSEGVRILHKTAVGLLPAAGLGVVRKDGPEHVVLTYADAFGITAYRVRERDLPEAVRPRWSGLLQVTEAELEAHPLGLVQSRLLHTGFPNEIRRQLGVRQIVTLPVPNGDRLSTLLVGLASERAVLTAAERSDLESLATNAVGFLNPVESSKSEVDLLRRLEAVEKLLPTLFRVLDVREIFDRLSAITKEVLRHDFASLGILSEDLTEVQLYVQTSPQSYSQGGPMPFPPVQTQAWLYRFVDDLTVHPTERHYSAQAGGRSSIRVAVRLDETVLGALNFTSRELEPYVATDLVIAQRIADYVGLALAHHRLAEESRRTAELRERAANLELLDGLLNTLSGVLDIREVFDRVSAIAQKVIRHDAMGLTEVINNGSTVRVHATQGFTGLQTPFDIPAPEIRLLSEANEFKLVDDLQQRPEYSHSPSRAAGMRSLMVVSIRVQDRHFGGLTFYSRTAGHFTRDDVLVARRISDHVALALSHQRLAEQARRNEELRARTTNLEMLDVMLTALTDVGSLSEVIDRVSEVAKKVLPHDAMIMPVVVQGDAARARFYVTTKDIAKFPEMIDIPESLRNSDWEYDLVDDLQSDPLQRNMMVAKLKYRSILRIPIRVEGQLVAGIGFLSFAPSAYTSEDVLAGRRIADRLAMSLLRERGLQASRRADEASERASKLESRVRALTEELDARTGYRRVVGESRQWRQVLTQATQVASTETTVLLLGESGTGKEVVARFLHRASARANG